MLISRLKNQSRYSNVPSILVVPNKTTLEILVFCLSPNAGEGNSYYLLRCHNNGSRSSIANNYLVFYLFVLQGKSAFKKIYDQQLCLIPLFQYIVYYLLPHISPRVKQSVQCLYSYMQCNDYFQHSFSRSQQAACSRIALKKRQSKNAWSDKYGRGIPRRNTLR